MRVLIIANSRSGKGRGLRAAEAARAWLSTREGGGHAVTMVAGGPGADAVEIERAAGAADVMVVAGGDGSVHYAAPVAMRTGVPIYHLPCGNENLIAREFGMTRRVEDVSRAIEGGKRVRVDVGRIAEDGGSGSARHFLLMMSFGPDASVVHRLAESRTTATGHLAYAGPVAAEFLRPHLPRLSVWVDGERVVDERRGMLVVANCGRYALGIDPCCRADMADGKLDVLFMPCVGRWGVIGWGWRCWRKIAERRGAVAGTGREIRVRADAAASQVDGEAHAVSQADAVCTVQPAALTCIDASGR